MVEAKKEKPEEPEEKELQLEVKVVEQETVPKLEV
jgi:hypothetical protein